MFPTRAVFVTAVLALTTAAAAATDAAASTASIDSFLVPSAATLEVEVPKSLPTLVVTVTGRTSTTVNLAIGGAGVDRAYFTEGSAKLVCEGCAGVGVDVDITGGTVRGLLPATEAKIFAEVTALDGRKVRSPAVSAVTCPVPVANAEMASSQVKSGACVQVCRPPYGGAACDAVVDSSVRGLEQTAAGAGTESAGVESDGAAGSAQATQDLGATAADKSATASQANGVRGSETLDQSGAAGVVEDAAGVSGMAPGIDPADVAECPAPTAVAMQTGWIDGSLDVLKALASTVLLPAAAAAAGAGGSGTCAAAPWGLVVGGEAAVVQALGAQPAPAASAPYVEIDMQLIGVITAINVETLVGGGGHWSSQKPYGVPTAVALESSYDKMTWTAVPGVTAASPVDLTKSASSAQYSVVRFAGTPPTPALPVTYVALPGVNICDWHFNTYHTGMSVDKCAAKCDAEPNCLVFSVSTHGCRVSKCGAGGGGRRARRTRSAL